MPRLLVPLMALGLAGCADSVDLSEPEDHVVLEETGTAVANIVVDSTRRYQTMVGWEATMASIPYLDSLDQATAGRIVDSIVSLGITRARLHANPDRIESRTPGVAQNDNSDPDVLDSTGFRWQRFDNTITKYILPLKARVKARGEPFVLGVSVGALGATTTAFLQTSEEEYLEYMLAVLSRLRGFGLEPDIWEVRNEPDNLNVQIRMSGTRIGEIIAHVAPRVRSAGYGRLMFGVPSTAYASQTVPYLNELTAMPGVSPYLKDVIYHRYGVAPTVAVLNGIRDASARLGLRTAMLERIGASENTLHDDLVRANVSSWQQFVGVGLAMDNSGYWSFDTVTGALRLQPNARYLQQYFRYVRPDAVRVAASSSQGVARPVGFRLATGKFVIVVITSGSVTLKVAGLPAGSYRVTFTGPVNALVARPAQILDAGQILTVPMSVKGVVSIVQQQ